MYINNQQENAIDKQRNDNVKYRRHSKDGEITPVSGHFKGLQAMVVSPGECIGFKWVEKRRSLR